MSWHFEETARRQWCSCEAVGGRQEQSRAGHVAQAPRGNPREDFGFYSKREEKPLEGLGRKVRRLDLKRDGSARIWMQQPFVKNESGQVHVNLVQPDAIGSGLDEFLTSQQLKYSIYFHLYSYLLKALYFSFKSDLIGR